MSPNPETSINIMGMGIVNGVDVIKKRWRSLQLKSHQRIRHTKKRNFLFFYIRGLEGKGSSRPYYDRDLGFLE